MSIIRRCYLDFRYALYKVIFPFPTIHASTATLDKLLSGNFSMARFGDGEFHMINQTENLGFQSVDNKLSQRLKEILGSDRQDCLICVPYGLYTIKHLTSTGNFFWKQFVVFHYRKLIGYFNFSKPYYDACVTRPYIDWRDKSMTGFFFDKIKQLWFGKRVLIVEGQLSRLGVGNDLFANVIQLSRIVTLSQDAFSVYDLLLAKTIILAPDYDLVLIALGPTATVLAYDLSVAGIRALDIGHVDIEYEWFLQRATKKVAVKGKFVNEVANPIAELDSASEQYESQIVSRVFIS